MTLQPRFGLCDILSPVIDTEGFQAVDQPQFCLGVYHFNLNFPIK
jgi:hypothetical protein